MIKKLGLWISVFALAILQSCNVSTETTYYKDSATSMESHILIDQSMLGMMNMMGNNTDVLKKSTDLGNLTTDWKSLFDLQKNGTITLNQDSAKVLKKMFLKLNKNKDEIYGISLKYDKLLPGEIASLLSQSKHLKSLPLQDMATWNGNTLTIDTDKFNSADFISEISKNTTDKEADTKPKTKSDSIAAYGKQMAQSMAGLMKMVNMNFSNTLKFQKPIKSIVGKHDFVQQIDNKTIQINVRSKDLMDNGKTLVNKDKKIIITTE